MGGALAQSISRNSETKVYIYDKIQEKAAALAEKCGGYSTDFDNLIASSDYIFLGVKPNVIEEVLGALKLSYKKRAVIVSMAAGIKIEKIEGVLQGNIPVIRIMPNTPVAVGAGLTAFSRGNATLESDVEGFKNLMSYTGATEELPESDIDAFCAIAGCGPAYAYMFIDALAKGGEACGIPRDKALSYAAKMIHGAALMTLQSDDEPDTLCKNVCSPGGATIEGVKVLSDANFTNNVSDAIKAAYKRTLELGK